MSMENELDQELGKLLDEMKGNGTMQTGTASKGLESREATSLELVINRLNEANNGLEILLSRILGVNNTISGPRPQEVSEKSAKEYPNDHQLPRMAAIDYQLTNLERFLRKLHDEVTHLERI